MDDDGLPHRRVRRVRGGRSLPHRRGDDPTLLLTLAIAAQFFRPGDPTLGFRRWDPTFILFEIALGEAAALAVVSGVEPNAGFLGLVCGSLASVFAAIAMVAIRGVSVGATTSEAE
ncbi:MAG TPA: hypothetical protein VH650_05130 [Gaiellaceae bacterium]|jgi:hypothetical protein